MRLEMVIRIQNEILDGESWGFFSNEPYKKKPVMTIEDFVLHSHDNQKIRVSSSREQAVRILGFNTNKQTKKKKETQQNGINDRHVSRWKA